MNSRLEQQIDPAMRINDKLPLVFQRAENDCSLACLAMLSQYHGLNHSLASLKRKFPVSSTGLSIKDLVETGGKIGLHLIPAKVEFKNLKELNLPAILYWGNEHFVVLKSASRREIVIHDPAAGLRKIKSNSATNRYSSIAIVNDKEGEFSIPEGGKLSARDLFKGIEGLRNALITISVLALGSQILIGAQPIFLQFALDEIISKRDLNLLVVLAIGFFLVTTTQIVISLLRELFIIKISTIVKYNLNTKVLSHLIRLPFAYYQSRNTGDIVTRFSVLGNIQGTIYQNAPRLLINALMLVISLTILLSYNLPLAALAIASSLVSIVIRILFYPKRHALLTDIQVSTSNMASTLMDIIRSYRAIKIFQMETSRAEKWQDFYLEYLTNNVKLDSRILYFSTLIDAVTKLDYLITLCLGVIIVLNDLMSTGMLMAFLSFKLIFSTSANESLEAILKLKLLRVDLDRVADIVLAKRGDQLRSPTADDLFSHDLKTSTGPCSLEVAHLAFKYVPDGDYIFKDVNLSVVPGERIAIVGPSGCGKTTLLSCLIGILSPVEGTITADGCAIITSAHYRDILSAVFQDDLLLDGTILENISCFSWKIDIEHVYHCASAADIHADILRMPLGYNTPVGDLGSTFSGGQRQRIFIARALYKRPRLLIFDEATSQLDEATELRVIGNLKKIKCTQIYVTHRPGVASALDRVIKMENFG
ncbi:MAG: peptidase domain-containing ABC transporter [Azoarcus sp.]|jgi:ATP-binding cassette subfamily B protein RaxB|nr:peptidase domain-containing ABC transporter [Azoarcus sp.]